MEETLREIERPLKDVYDVMFCNAVFKKRTVGVGVIDPAWLDPYGVTGPNARAAGVAKDVRGSALSGLSRARLRAGVHRPGLRHLHPRRRAPPRCAGVGRPDPPDPGQDAQGRPADGPMPNVLHWKIPRGETYIRGECSRGEYGYYLVTDGSGYPRRVNVRGPSYTHAMALLERMIVNCNISDGDRRAHGVAAHLPAGDRAMSVRDLLLPFTAWKNLFRDPVSMPTRSTVRRHRAIAASTRTTWRSASAAAPARPSARTAPSTWCRWLRHPDQNGAIAGRLRPARPRIDYGRCCWCALCVDVCMTKSLTMSNAYTWVESDPDKFRFTPASTRSLGRRRTGLSPPRGHRLTARRASPWRAGARGAHRLLRRDRAGLHGRSRPCWRPTAASPAACASPPARRTWRSPIHQAAVRDGDYERGALLYDSNPFSGICGRVCTHKCETTCAARHEGDAIAIRWLKRHIMDQVTPSNARPVGGPGAATGKGSPSSAPGRPASPPPSTSPSWATRSPSTRRWTSPAA
jgi:Pyruvate/2-oxoacid:ferredoxin oxidoreductase delta subunit